MGGGVSYEVVCDLSEVSTKGKLVSLHVISPASHKGQSTRHIPSYVSTILLFANHESLDLQPSEAVHTLQQRFRNAPWKSLGTKEVSLREWESWVLTARIVRAL